MSKSVLVVGGGVIGLCIAYYAARKGHRVTLLDRSPEHRDGCSFGNAGMIVPSHFIPLAAPGMVGLGLRLMGNPESPFAIKPQFNLPLLRWAWNFYRAATPKHVRRAAPLLRDLHLASRSAFAELAAEPDSDFGLTQNGLLMLCRTQHALDEEARTAELANRLGVPAEVLDARATAKRDPAIRMDVLGSVFFPKDCHLSPHRFMAGLKYRLDQLTTGFLWETPVTGWRVEGTRVAAVQTARGDLTADEYVLCSGIWSATLTRGLQLHLPMQAGKGYSLTLSQPRVLPQICAILTEARVAVTPISQSLRFAGTLELGGLDGHVSPARVQGIIKSIPRYYPDFNPADFDGIRPWHGLRPCSPDGLPYLGRVASYANLSVATGHAMMGLSLGPVTGQLVAALLSDETPPIDIRLLSPDRYG